MFRLFSSVEDLLKTINRKINNKTITRAELDYYDKQLSTHLELNNRNGLILRRIKNTQISLQNYSTKRMNAEDAVHPFAIQVPSEEDLDNMQGMLAAIKKEDQKSRLTHMRETIEHLDYPIRTTDEALLNPDWQQLFDYISAGRKKMVNKQLRLMRERNDSLFNLLLAIHPYNYIEKLIYYCLSAKAQETGVINISAHDIIITNKTFELLVRDLACSVEASTPIYFSFGLPSHHAFTNRATGFCLLNKVALLIKHTEPKRCIVIGTDVNRDNGLCDVLRERLSHLPLYHIDIFDSRVYPVDDFDDIDQEFEAPPELDSLGIPMWQKDNLHYYAVDLAQHRRTPEHEVHPALTFAIEQLKEQVKQAQLHQEPLSLFLPSGWDSHQDETASCSKKINGVNMSRKEAENCRFNNEDLVYFYKEISRIYNENKTLFTGIYWGLEGGYNRAMYEEQLSLMLATFKGELRAEPQESDQNQMLIY